MAVVVVVALVLGAGGGAAIPALAADDPGVQPQVIGGRMVPDGKHRFVAALLDTRFGSTPTKQQFCDGTLIDQNSVLTAAHCVVGISPKPLRVLVGRTDSNVPVDPAIYRIHEITQVYGTTIKALIHEEFGDGIMSAINFKMDLERVEHPEGDRVRITYEGKFLPYQW